MVDVDDLAREYMILACDTPSASREEVLVTFLETHRDVLAGDTKGDMLSGVLNVATDLMREWMPRSAHVQPQCGSLNTPEFLTAIDVLTTSPWVMPAPHGNATRWYRWFNNPQITLCQAAFKEGRIHPMGFLSVCEMFARKRWILNPVFLVEKFCHPVDMTPEWLDCLRRVCRVIWSHRDWLSDDAQDVNELLAYLPDAGPSNAIFREVFC